MKTVMFRVDGNKTIGMGHVMRCLALASAFSKNKFRVIFILSDDSMQYIIKLYGFDFINVRSKFSDYNFNSSVFFDCLKRIKPSIVVVDNYFVSISFIMKIQELAKVLYISEEYDLRIARTVDYFLNYNIYMNSVIPIQSDGLQMLGTKFTLLREEFAKPLRNAPPLHKNITIFTGGSDMLNVAPILARQLTEEESLCDYQISVVSSMLNPNLPKLITMASYCNRLTISIEPKSMTDIMDKTSISISSGGSTLYELCSRGIPSISYSIASNQDNIVNEFDRLQLIPYAGNMISHKDESIRRCVSLAVEFSESSRLDARSNKMATVCNRNGAQLVVEMIMNSTPYD